MPKTTTPVFTQKVIHTGTTFLTAYGTAANVIATGGADDSRIVRLSLSSDDTVANKAFFYIRLNSYDYPIAWVNIAAGSGTNGTVDMTEAIAATTFLHRQIDNNGNPYVELQAAIDLRMKLQVAPSPTKTVTAIVTQENY